VRLLLADAMWASEAQKWQPEAQRKIYAHELQLME
jgi:hypothetical protein